MIGASIDYVILCNHFADDLVVGCVCVCVGVGVGVGVGVCGCVCTCTCVGVCAYVHMYVAMCVGVCVYELGCNSVTTQTASSRHITQYVDTNIYTLHYILSSWYADTYIPS